MHFSQYKKASFSSRSISLGNVSKSTSLGSLFDRDLEFVEVAEKGDDLGPKLNLVSRCALATRSRIRRE